ncbi:hypothetical protein M758_2G116200 [Ceratodon purpureus]|nr:hypothetical protein M758_2G116200 [Ceratodon purpureus]
MGRMETAVAFLVLLGFASAHLVAAEVSSTVTPAFVWSDLRCLGEKDQSVVYESQTPHSLVGSVLTKIYAKCSATPKLEGEVAYPEMIVAFIGKELRSEDISRSYSSGVLKTLEESVAGAKFSMSIPYVTVSSDKTSVAESLVSHKALNRALKIKEVAVSGSCSVGGYDVKKLTDAPDILAYISGRKSSRVVGGTDILVICYSPSLDWNLEGISNSEGEVLAEVLSALKSSGTSNAVLYSSDPRVAMEKHFGIMERHLLDGTGNTTTDCDALCRSRAVILEGIFVAITLITILVSGICCMKAVKSPTRFEVSKDQ